MYGAVVNEEALRARFDLVEIDGEGILLDRDTGAVYRLNRTGYEVWASLAAGRSVAQIVAEVVRRFGLDRDTAGRDVLAVLESFPDVPPRPPEDAFRWIATPDGYGYFENDTLICEVDARGDFLRLRAGSAPTTVEAQIRLKSVVPKILSLRGIRALHAAAVEIDGALLLFCGRSGAGKTTSVRMFGETGRRVVSEDLLILSIQDAGCRAILGGEATIRQWAAREGARLARQPDQSLDCSGLDACLGGEGRPIRRILLIDADRRAGDGIIVEDLPRADALVALMDSTYFGSADVTSWTSTLESLRRLVNEASTARAVMPRGIHELRRAVGALPTAL
jgi:Coenzyme PQQ synthesis protein D (PqqD)